MKNGFREDVYDGAYVMHCPTQEKAKAFCRYLASIGRAWKDSIKYTAEDYWDKYKENTCYAFNEGNFCDVEYFKNKEYRILEFDDFNFNDYWANQDIKADNGKPKLSLVPMQILSDIARVREFGVQKYGEKESWREVETERYIDALLRNIVKFAENPTGTDKESELPHLWHIACNVAFLCEKMKGEF